MIKSLLRIIFKVTGGPSLWLILRQKYYLEDPYKKTRSIKGGAIFISNHTHIMDFFTMVFTHPFRKERFLISEAIYQHRILGFMCNVMNSIMIHRERNDLSFIGEAEQTLKNGCVITIFPEGHLMHNGKLDTFKPSAIYLALRTGAPIIPHYIDAHYFKFKRTRIIVGKPIYVKDYLSDNPTTDEVRKVCEMLQKKTYELKRKMEIYRKYKTRSIIYWKAWFLDITKAILWLPNKFVFPTKFHYVNGATKKDRKPIGRALIVSNHKGFIDPPILAMHYFSRRVRIIVAGELMDKFGWYLRHLLAIKYERIKDQADPKCFLEVINVLKGEGVVGLYPEGHIGGNEFHDGAAYFSLITNTPIHFYYMLHNNKKFHRNHIMIGKTIYPNQFFSLDEMQKKETIAKFTKIIKQEFDDLRMSGETLISSKK